MDGRLYENKYPLVAKGMWSGIVDLKTQKLLNWKLEYGTLYLQAKICDSGTYFLLDKDKKAICRIAGYVPNGLIPDCKWCKCSVESVRFLLMHFYFETASL